MTEISQRVISRVNPIVIRITSTTRDYSIMCLIKLSNESTEQIVSLIRKLLRRLDNGEQQRRPD